MKSTFKRIFVLAAVVALAAADADKTDADKTSLIHERLIYDTDLIKL